MCVSERRWHKGLRHTRNVLSISILSHHVVYASKTLSASSYAQPAARGQAEHGLGVAAGGQSRSGAADGARRGNGGCRRAAHRDDEVALIGPGLVISPRDVGEQQKNVLGLVAHILQRRSSVSGWGGLPGCAARRRGGLTSGWNR